MSFTPTRWQQEAIDEQGNCVIVAVPGSGKTFTISQKIKQILCPLPPYKGIVAISYTNKASDELKSRCLDNGEDKKGAFFGTIDIFFLVEIIIPFGKQLFGLPKNEIEVIKSCDAELSDIEEAVLKAQSYKLLESMALETLTELYLDGKIILESFGFFALYIYRNSKACQQYLCARYSHIFIDEYQDCGYWQNCMFEDLVELGLIGIAVGDIHQSIFAFAGKSSKYLEQLRNDKNQYKVFALPDNHRCHNSIVHYSSVLIGSNIDFPSIDEHRVFHKKVEGSEIDIAKWIASKISVFQRKYNIQKRKNIAILVSGRKTGTLIAKNIGIPHKPIVDTDLDNDSSPWGSLFRKILFWVFNDKATKYELLENYFIFDNQSPKLPKVMKLLDKVDALLESNQYPVPEALTLFKQIAQYIYPQDSSNKAINRLQNVLSNRWKLSSFTPPADDEVQIMTLHKSKGLEFDIVFHLDLYKWILPKYKGNEIQCRNLHYVGLTRAKECCILCTSTKRHKTPEKIVPAEDSPFLKKSSLSQLRITI